MAGKRSSREVVPSDGTYSGTMGPVPVAPVREQGRVVPGNGSDLRNDNEDLADGYLSERGKGGV